MSTEVLDVEFLIELLDGDREFAEELFSIFAETSIQCLRTAESACREREQEVAVRAFHTLKGAAASVGLATLRQQSRGLELLAEQASFTECLDGLRELGATVEMGNARLTTFLQGYGL